jgi:hypothetical protein
MSDKVTGTVYGFGPNSDIEQQSALMEALRETFPSAGLRFDHNAFGHVTIVAETAGRHTVGAWQLMMTFARGFIAGYRKTVPAPGEDDQRRRLTLPETPAAKRSSSVPPAPISQPPVTSRSPYTRRHTVEGVAPPSHMGLRVIEPVVPETRAQGDDPISRRSRTIIPGAYSTKSFESPVPRGE